MHHDSSHRRVVTNHPSGSHPFGLTLPTRLHPVIVVVVFLQHVWIGVVVVIVVVVAVVVISVVVVSIVVIGRVRMSGFFEIDRFFLLRDQKQKNHREKN